MPPASAIFTRGTEEPWPSIRPLFQNTRVHNYTTTETINPGLTKCRNSVARIPDTRDARPAPVGINSVQFHLAPLHPPPARIKSPSGCTKVTAVKSQHRVQIYDAVHRHKVSGGEGSRARASARGGAARRDCHVQAATRLHPPPRRDAISAIFTRKASRAIPAARSSNKVRHPRLRGSASGR